MDKKIELCIEGSAKLTGLSAQSEGDSSAFCAVVSSFSKSMQRQTYVWWT